MKRTKSMIYRPTEESRELMLYTVNDGRIYEGIITAVLNNLRKHYKKGVYSTDKAVDAWYQVATEGSRSYNKEFGYSFSVGDRFTVAVELEKYYREDVEEA